MIALAARLALRDARGGWRPLRVVLACLALAVATIATVGTLRDSIEAGIALHGREILGGDLSIAAGNDPLPATLTTWLAARHARVSQVQLLRALLVSRAGERQLVELKAVDAAWPLLGHAAPLPGPGLTAEPLVLSRLGVATGGQVRLGNVWLPIQGPLTAEPDHAATPSFIGPRAIIAAATLPATGLIQPGSMVTNELRVLWPSGTNPATARAALESAFPNNHWHIRGPQDAVPGATRFIDQLAVFLSLVGLASLLVGGIGVATGVRAWVDGRAHTIATLRCLGASTGLVFTLAAMEVMALCTAGIAAGLVLGAVLPAAALHWFRDALPVPPRIGIYPAPLALSALFGLLAAAAFALPPLGRAMRIPGAALFRAGLAPTAGRLPRPILLLTALLVAILAALAIATSPDHRLAAGFCAAALATLALFRLAAAAVRLAARAAAAIPRPSLRLGLGNLYRPGNATPLMMMALGLGLSTLAAITLIEGNLHAQLQAQLPRHAPSFFFIDIQNDQTDRFRALAASTPGAADIQMVPSLVSRVTAVDNIPVEQLHPTPDTEWAMRGDRGLTYAAAPPAGTTITAGHWWPADYSGPPLVSFDENLAKGWHVGVGHTITIAVLGRPVTLTIANLRRIDYRSMTINFAMIASPGLLTGAPHGNLATVRIPPANAALLLRRITDALPNVTGIEVATLLATVGRLLGQIGTALAAIGTLTLASGALVLAGAVASGQRQRIHQAVILKTLGATAGQIRTAWLTEFAALGLSAGLTACAIGTAASYAVMHFVMHADWTLLPARLAITIAGCTILMLVLGSAGTEAALRSRPARKLREE